MGKINCTSNKIKFEDNISKKKAFNEFEKSVLEEYDKLKSQIEGKTKSSLVDVFFMMNNYKKKLTRFQKWINIAYQEIPEDQYKLMGTQKMTNQEIKDRENFVAERINYVEEKSNSNDSSYYNEKDKQLYYDKSVANSNNKFESNEYKYLM